MILIVGATGKLGRATARLLLEAGIGVRAMTRHPEQAGDLRQLGAEVVFGDLIDHESLARACVGAQSVLAAAHAMIGRGAYRSELVDDAGHRALIDAAKAAGVEHFVYTSIQGAAPDHPVDFWRTKYAIEQYLKASGLSYTILRPAAFMEDHAHEFLGKAILERGSVTILGRGNNPTNMVAVRDVAQFALIALTDPRARGETIEIGGPENLTKNQIAELYGRVAGVTPTVRHMPPVVLRVISAVLRPFHPGVSRVMQLSAAVDETDQTLDPTVTLQRYPLKLTHMEDFVRERVAEVGRPVGPQPHAV
jgi:uncharacterized protein YbjT (DUF2867 family)